MGATPSTTALLETAARPRRWAGASWLLGLGVILLGLAWASGRSALSRRDLAREQSIEAARRLERVATLRAEMARLAGGGERAPAVDGLLRHAELARELKGLVQEQSLGPEGSLAGLPRRTAELLARLEEEALRAGRPPQDPAYATARHELENSRAAASAALSGWTAEQERHWRNSAGRQVWIAGAGLLLVALGGAVAALGLRSLGHLDSDLADKTRDLAGFGNRLKQLHRLGNSQYGSTEALVRDYLQTGCTVLEMELGAFEPAPGIPASALLESRGTVPPGDETALRHELTHAPLGARATLSYPGEPPLPDELAAALARQDLGSYLGARVQDGEATLGALGFAAGPARGVRPFNLRDIELVELLAGGLAARLGELVRGQERERAARALGEAARLRSEFLAITSHELRTPLNAIMGMSGVLLDTPLSPEQRDHAETIRASSHMLLDLINDVLDLSKLEAGQLELHEIEYDLRDVVEELLDMLGPLALARGLELVGHVSPELPGRLLGDPARLRQVLANLTANAIKFSSSGHVVVRAAPGGADPLDLLIEVEDTGVGIPLEAQARLFQPYVQVEADARGTGLGLSISKRLVERMGGTIGLQSQAGIGSTFWFTLRARPAPQGSEPPRVRALAGLSVLLAEPDAACRTMLHDTLEAAGARVTACSDSAAAEQALNQDPHGFSYLMLDSALASGSGQRLLDARARARDCRLVLMAPGGPAGRELARHVGAPISIAKPLRARRVVERLARSLQPPGAPSADPGWLSPHDGGPARILLVEDDPVNQRVALAQLEQLGQRADVVTGGRAALAAVRGGSYGLVLMDCRIPDLDGLEVARRLRQLPGGRGRIPIVALTAGGHDAERRACLKAGMDDYLTKPLGRAELERTLQRWLAEPHPPEHAVAPALEDLFDPERIALLRSSGPGFLEQIMSLAMASTPAQLESLRRAVEDGDGAAVEFLAHTLKSRWLNLGAVRLSELLSELEERARAGQLDDAAERARELLREFERLRAAT